MTELRQHIEDTYPDDGLLFADGFDEAIIGVSTDARVVYSATKAVGILEQQMGAEAAVEYFEVNVACAYFGEKTPIWVYDGFLELQ